MTIYGNGHSINAGDMKEGAIFVINNDADVRMINLMLEGAHAFSGNHLKVQTRMGGAVFVDNSNLTVINCTFKDNEAKDGFGGAIYGVYANLNVICSRFINNSAANGSALCIWRGNANILISNVNPEDVHSELDIDNDLLGSIAIFNDLNLMANISNFTEGENAQIRITEPSNFSGGAKLNVGGKVFDIQFNEDGAASVLLDVAPGKAYAATITSDYAEYARDIGLNIAKLYMPTTTATNSFKVMKKPNIQFDVKNITYNQIQTIKATINGAGNVTVKLNGITIVDNSFINKTFDYTIGNLNVGIYSIELNYSGDEFTIPGVAVFNFTVNKIASALSASSLTTVYNGGKYLVATLKDNDRNAIAGVNVEINLNGVIYNKITDKNGNVKVSTDALDPKTYSATISFAGNAIYLKSTKTVSVKVTKATPKLAASKKSFKKSVKVKKYVVVLKTNRNKALGSAWVTLKVNKKTYKVKTDKGGKATFKITKLKKKGKYAAVVMYSGNKCYNAKSVNVKITVK